MVAAAFRIAAAAIACLLATTATESALPSDSDPSSGSLSYAPLIEALTLALHQQQHPGAPTTAAPGSGDAAQRAACAQRRLLVTHFDPKSFEGIGSIVKVTLRHGASWIHRRSSAWARMDAECRGTSRKVYRPHVLVPNAPHSPIHPPYLLSAHAPLRCP